jgi:hypothetical protein
VTWWQILLLVAGPIWGLYAVTSWLVFGFLHEPGDDGWNWRLVIWPPWYLRWTDRH